MSRVPQQVGTRGSLKWIQRFIAERPDALRPDDLPSIEWISPLQADDYAEYSDKAFLKLIGYAELQSDLKRFWPVGGPQWDAVGISNNQVIAVEAKAHLAEFFSSGTMAGQETRPLIESSLTQTKVLLGAKDVSDWSKLFYQYANRLAWLNWLRTNGVDARLLFVSFIGDRDMGGPSSREPWQFAFKTAEHELGLNSRHPLSAYISYSYPDVTKLS
jgi:hypothetical protein